MIKKIILFLIILTGIIFLTFWYFTKSEPVKELIVSGHPEWPPIMYQQDDQIVGAGSEIAKKIFSELGIKVFSKYEGPWDVVQEKAKSGSVDVLAAAYKTAERETYMEYSIPYTIDPVALVVKKGKLFPYDKWEDLIKKKVVVTIGDSYGQDFDDFIKEKMTVRKVATPKEAFDLLDKEEADCFVYALYSVENYFFTNKVSEKFEIVPKYVSSENFFLTISKKSPYVSLMPKVNELLKKYQKDGTIEKIIEKNKQTLWNENK